MRWAEKRRNIEGRSRWQDLTEAKPTPLSDTLPLGWVFPARAERTRRGGKGTRAGERAEGSRERKLILGAQLPAWVKHRVKVVQRGSGKQQETPQKVAEIVEMEEQ